MRHYDVCKGGFLYMITIKDLTVHLDNQLVLDHLDFHIGKNEIVLITGDNGSGKSTLLKTIAGRYKYDSGSVEIQEPFIYHQQQYPLLQDMTIKENMIVYSNILGFSINQKAKDILGCLGLASHMSKTIDKLSGGQQQRTGLAITLLRHSNLYLLDEADSAMDPNGRALYYELLNSLKKSGKSIVLISHHVKEAGQIADRVYSLSKGTGTIVPIDKYEQKEVIR